MMTRMTLALMCALTTLTGAAWAQSGANDDDGVADASGEGAWKEVAYALPAAPVASNLRDLRLNQISFGTFQFDVASLSVGADGVIRYTLVAQGRGGATSTTFEGIRCKTGERRMYASMGKTGEWRPLTRSVWVPIGAGVNNPRAALASNFFCDGEAPAFSVAQILSRLNGEIDMTDPVRGGVR
jgi:hypothetical protein